MQFYLKKFFPSEEDTRQRICHLQLEAIREVESYLDRLERFWQKRMDHLGYFLDQQEE